MSAIQSDYRTFKHIPSRKCYQLIMEIPEEEFANVCNVLGYPKTGENTYVAIALLNCTPKSNNVPSKVTTEQIEGNKLRTRAVMLCKDNQFQEYTKQTCWSVNGVSATEECASEHLKAYCGIESRSELATNIEAQQKFRALDQNYKDWLFIQNHAENLDRL